MRRWVLWANLLGVALVTVGIVCALTFRASSDQRAEDLASDTAQRAATYEDSFERARAIDLLLAGDSAWGDFYAAGGSRAQKADGDPLVQRMNRVLAGLERVYSGEIGEACFIDASGVENARVVNGVGAAHAALSTNEKSNPFFAPAMALTPGKVYESAPYLSQDTHQWVIGVATPVEPVTGVRALVHFEITFDTLRGGLVMQDRHDAAYLVDAASGRVLLDAQQPHGGQTGALGSTAGSAVAFRGLHGEGGVINASGRQVAYHRIAGGPYNGNDWYIAVAGPRLSVLQQHRVGAPIAALLVGLLLIGLALREMLRRQRRLGHVARTDELTGLANRTALYEQLNTRTAEDGARLALLFLDLDGFKEINDTLGHDQGDELLTVLGQRLQDMSTAEIFTARLGGDEFAIVIAGVDDADEAVLRAAELHRQLTAPLQLRDLTVTPLASVGVALWPEHANSIEELLRHSDVAMYRAKHSYDHVQVFCEEQRRGTRRRLRLAADLRRVIDDGSLAVHFQPEVDLLTGEVVGIEALARWSNGDAGDVAPGEFIPLAEDVGLIHPLTMVVLDNAVASCRVWLEAGFDIPVSVNLSARCFSDRTLTASVAAMLDRHQLPPHMLRLEITETAVTADRARLATTVSELNEVGIGIQLDDFGTGYSSLALLRGLPLQAIKIDQTFTAGLLSNDTDAFIVRSTIELAHRLGLHIVAEGVEDEETARALRALGCDAAQGYLYSAAVPRNSLLHWLRQHDLPPVAQRSPSWATASS